MLRKLYYALLRPVEPWLHPRVVSHNPDPKIASPGPFRRCTLTIVPYGSLFQAPFAAFITPDGSYLIQKYALRTAPSLTVLRFTRNRSALLQKSAMHAILFGNPEMPGTMPPLPAAQEEVHTIASILGPNATSIIHLRENATEAAFRAEAPTATEIHLATHGYVSQSDPLLSGLILSPSKGPEPLYQRDGYLTTAEIFRLKLNARLVTLSACDTGLGAISADGVFGLQSAFLTAGSASLLSSLWKVNDAATAELMKQFYQKLQADPRHDRALALQSAQMSLLQSTGFRNPVYWAAFVLTGEVR